jgi:hypothetical protein
MHGFLGSASKQLDCLRILCGGVKDHINLMARLSRTISQSDWVKELRVLLWKHNLEWNERYGWD